MVFPRKSENAFSKVFLAVLKLAVYSNSAFLTMTLLSLYGLINGVAYVPRKRLSAVKSILHYGVNVLHHGLNETTRIAASSR